MIPVYQTMTVANDGQGNCFNACIASILELPLREVANILPRDERYWGPWQEWFTAKGLQLRECSAKNPPKGWAIASGDGFRVYPDGHEKAGKPISHATVAFNGEVLHDPFPGGKGLAHVSYYWAIEPILAGLPIAVTAA
jgi:hypothetical protein